MSTNAIFEKFDPRTGEVLASYKNFSQNEVFEVVERAHDAAIRWHEFGFTARKRVLIKWASYITKNQKEIAKLIADECGKPIGDATLKFQLQLIILLGQLNMLNRLCESKIVHLDY